MNNVYNFGNYYLCLMVNDKQIGRYFFLKLGRRTGEYTNDNIFKVCFFKKDESFVPGLDLKLGA